MTGGMENKKPSRYTNRVYNNDWFQVLYAGTTTINWANEDDDDDDDPLHNFGTPRRSLARRSENRPTMTCRARFLRLPIVLFAVAGSWWGANPVGAEPEATAAVADPVVSLSRIDHLIDRVREQPLAIESASPWEIVHGIMAFEDQATVVDGSTGKRIDAIDFLLRQATYEGHRLFREIDGVVTLPEGTEEKGLVETHRDQFLMALANAGVSPETEALTDEGGRVSVAELVQLSKQGFRIDQELGWTLVALSTYLQAGERWANDQGEELSLTDLVERAIYRDPRMETEGGHHHLYGVAYAVDRHQRTGGGGSAKIWLKARFYLDNFIEHVKAYQQDDGAFSAAGFRGSKAPSSPEIDLQETGHGLEWLVISLPPEELGAPWVRRAVSHLCDVLESNPLDRFHPGALYHAAHALRLYRARISPVGDPTPTLDAAAGPSPR